MASPTEMATMIDNADGSVSVYEDAAAMAADVPAQNTDAGYDETWFGNLAENMDPDYLHEQALEILNLVRIDNDDRSAFLEGVENGIKVLTEGGGLDEDDEARREMGLSEIKHPVLSEAAILFGSRAVEEAMPREGPVKTKVAGSSTAEKEQKAARLKTFLNHQLQTSNEYVRDTDRLFNLLPLAGTIFRRLYWDPARREVRSCVILPQDISVNPEASSLEDASRIAWRYRISLNEYNRLVESGWYLPIEDPKPMNKTTRDMGPDDAVSKASGVRASGASDPYAGNDMMVQLVEVHAGWGFTDQDGMSGDEGDRTRVVPPYVITIEEQSNKIVSIRRNWRRGDDAKIKFEHFVDYGFQPGPQFWHLGLYNFVGAFYKGATGACRALLDSAWRENMPGGFISSGALDQDGDSNVVELGSGDYIVVHPEADDISKSVMPNPSSQPSPVLMQLLDIFVATIRRFVDTADLNMEDLPQNVPASAMLSVMEKGDRRARAIQKRIYDSQDREFKIMMRLWRENIQGKVSFASHGEVMEVYAADFDGVDVMPMSDPNTASQNQRLLKVQNLLQWQQLFPGLIEEKELLRRAFKAIDAEDVASLWKQPEQIPSADPITENGRMLQMQPVGAEILDDDESHIAVHVWLAQNPSSVAMIKADDTGQIANALKAHIAEHYANLAMKQVVSQIKASTGMDIPLEQMMDQLPPEARNMLAMAAANIVTANPDLARVPALEALDDNVDPVTEMKIKEQEIRNQSLMNEEQRKAVAFEREQERTDLKNQQELNFGAAKFEQELEHRVRMAEVEIRKKVELQFQDDLNAARDQNRKDVETLAEIRRSNEKLKQELEEIKKRGLIQRMTNKGAK